MTEEGGKLAGAVVEGLKSNPSCLAALCFALLLVGFVYLSFHEYQVSVAERQKMLIERCFPLHGKEKA